MSSGWGVTNSEFIESTVPEPLGLASFNVPILSAVACWYLPALVFRTERRSRVYSGGGLAPDSLLLTRRQRLVDIRNDVVDVFDTY